MTTIAFPAAQCAFCGPTTCMEIEVHERQVDGSWRAVDATVCAKCGQPVEAEQVEVKDD